MGEQVLGHLAAHAVAGDAAHGAQHLLHARRVALHLLHPAETEPVGLLLVLAAVLQVDRLTGGHGADQEPLGERRHAQGQTGDAGQDRHRADLGTLVEPLGDVPADHVPDLVGEHAEQLVLGAHGLDQAGVEEHQPGRGGKGVELVALDHEEAVVEVLRADVVEHLVAERVDVRADVRVVEHGQFAADREEQLLTDLALLADGQGGHLQG